jgi:N utilization substance protein A
MVVSELRGEKIDIIPYNDEPARFVAKALSPARVREVLVEDETKEATVIVPDDQLSLAIGRDGQNARLAARLTGWKVDIKSETEFASEEEDIEYEGEEAADGRCLAVLTTGRRCPNASLEGSHYCGIPQHQALAHFGTNQVAVLTDVSEEEVTQLAAADAGDASVKAIVERAESGFDEAAAEAEAAEAEAEEETEDAEEEAAADGEVAEETAEAEEAADTEADAETEEADEEAGAEEESEESEEEAEPVAEAEGQAKPEETAEPDQEPSEEEASDQPGESDGAGEQPTAEETEPEEEKTEA